MLTRGGGWGERPPPAKWKSRRRGMEARATVGKSNLTRNARCVVHALGVHDPVQYDRP